MPRASQDLATVVSGGDRLASLCAVRDKLATELTGAAGSSAAAVVRELRAVLAEIEAVAPTKEGSQVDQLASRRAARLAEAEGQPGSDRKRGGRPGGRRAG